MPRIDAELPALQARELVPFRAAIAAGTRAVMSAHILLPALDRTRPATLSPGGPHGLLRERARLRRADRHRRHGDAGHLRHLRPRARQRPGHRGRRRRHLRGRRAGRRGHRAAAARRPGEGGTRRRAAARSGWPTRRPECAPWHAGHGTPARGRRGSRPHPAIGLAAARRALRLTGGPYAPLTEPAYVAAFTPLANIAVGDETPWGVAAELRRLLPGTDTATYTGEAAATPRPP